MLITAQSDVFKMLLYSKQKLKVSSFTVGNDKEATFDILEAGTN